MSRFRGFSPEAISFLRALKRNNRREWFQPRKEKYEALIKAPMLEFVGCMNEELARFAPAYVTPPAKAVYRIYRDTRFSPDKTPYKTHIAAIFPHHSAVKREGAVADPASTDENVQGIRKFNEALAAEKRVTTTVIQTVGSKGYDGLALILVTANS